MLQRWKMCEHLYLVSLTVWWNIVYWTHAKFKFTWLPKWFWTISTIIHVFSRCWSHWFGWKTYEGCIKYKQNGNQLGVSTCKTYQGKNPLSLARYILRSLRCPGQLADLVRLLRAAPQMGRRLACADGVGKRLWRVGRWKLQPQHSGKMTCSFACLIHLPRFLLVSSSFLLLWVCWNDRVKNRWMHTELMIQTSSSLVCGCLDLRTMKCGKTTRASREPVQRQIVGWMWV